jgi:glycosyltransferase involved in cell wall biosynthesis
VSAPLTVLLPGYNTAAYLAEAVRSVLAQTFREFDLLVIDDGSTDDTLAVAQELARSDARIRVLTQPNAGIAHTMNRGIDLARGEWVACMHGDDVMLPHRLERQVAFLSENPDLDVASALVYLVDGRGRRIGAQRSPFTARGAAAEYVRRSRPIVFNHPCAIFRKSAVQGVGGYRQAFWPAEDMDLWTRMAERGHGILVQPEYLLHYRIHGASASISRARLMVRRTAWIERCMACRRTGEPEPTWDAFLAGRRSGGWAARANLARREAARTLYQTSQHYLAARRYHALLPAMAGAAVLDPGLVLGRVLPRVGRAARRALGRRNIANGDVMGPAVPAD